MHEDMTDSLKLLYSITISQNPVCASSSTLAVPATRRSTLGDRAFAVAGQRAWNSLPEFVTDCSSPLTFKKYHLFI